MPLDSVIISFVHEMCPALVTLTISGTRVVYGIPAVPLTVDTIQTVRPTGIVILLPGIGGHICRDGKLTGRQQQPTLIIWSRSIE